MAYALTLPARLQAQGWRVKIRDRERNEPPHVTVMRRTRAWRFDLRALKFLDAQPDPREVPQEVVDRIVESLELLRAKWDEMYPENPIRSKEEADD